MGGSSTSVPIACLLLAVSGSAEAQPHPETAAATAAIETIRSFDHRLHHVLRRRVPDWSPEAELCGVQLRELVDQTLAIPELARTTLGTHWSEASEQQREVFLRLFRELLVQRLASGLLLDYDAETAPTATVLADGTADVEVLVREGEGRAPPRRAMVSYRLKLLDGRWQLVDVLVDGHSVVGEYRYQFNRIIARERFDGLLARMRRKVKGPT